MPHLEEILDVPGGHLRRIPDLLRLGIPLIVRLRVLMLLSGSYDRIRGIHRGLVGPVLLR